MVLHRRPHLALFYGVDYPPKICAWDWLSLAGQNRQRGRSSFALLYHYDPATGKYGAIVGKTRSGGHHEEEDAEINTVSPRPSAKYCSRSRRNFRVGGSRSVAVEQNLIGPRLPIVACEAQANPMRKSLGG